SSASPGPCSAAISAASCLAGMSTLSASGASRLPSRERCCCCSSTTSSGPRGNPCDPLLFIRRWCMNLVDVIKNQLSNGAVHQLSTLLGAGERTTWTAVEAAVPALLSGLSNLASNPAGAQKLTNALGKFDSATSSHLAQGLADHPGSLLEQGSALLSSLL